MTERVYRNINRPLILMGLELIDLGILTVVFLLVFFVSNHLVLNGLLMAACYGFLRFLKHDKPDGFALHLAKYLTRPTFYKVSLEKETKGGTNG